ncbi:MAG: aminopeptidase [Gammaproteobacteria bacterium]|nr:aminopeptidase [Gammaproteobacteria bacterium]MBT4492594.1 aminopeptidase [Gammaproteobacteria bacterium]
MSVMRVTCLAAAVFLMSGCQMVGYYHQAIVGQGKLLLNRQQNASLLASAKTDPALKYRLELAAEVVRFAIEAGLPAEGAYQSYVETGQSFVVWNVFAAPTFQLELKTSCFPVAGCVSYRGFFGREDAIAYGESLKREGYDVYVGGVSAYSTLGWFDDPLLDTFLFQPEEHLAALLFHELAHRVLYVRDDTRFNESLATSIEKYLLRTWLNRRGEPDRFDRYLASEQRQVAVLDIIGATRERLRSLYQTNIPVEEMRIEKSAILAQLVETYGGMSAGWSEGAEFGRWMSSPINNAKLETVADYNDWVPPMTQLLESKGLGEFVKEMERLADLSEQERTRELQAIGR